MFIVMPGRPREFDRDEALGAACELFWSRGYEPASLTLLLQAMNISRQSVYDTYGDKEALFLEALKLYAERVHGEISTVLSGEPTPLTSVRNFLRGLAERTTSPGGRGCLLTNSLVEVGPHNAEVQQFITGVLAKLEDRLTSLLKAAIQAHELPPRRHPRELARFLITLMQGTLVLSKTNMSATVKDALRCAEDALGGD